jgi:hypothetical protein
MWHANTINICRHAQRRMAQRGVTLNRLTQLLEHADREAFVGSGATSLSVSRKIISTLNLDDRLCGFAAIISGQGTLITVLPMLPGRTGRRYRGRN